MSIDIFHLIVKSAGKDSNGNPTEIPIEEVDRVLVFGNIQLSTQAIGVCLEAQIPVIFLSQLGEYKGHLWSSEQTNLPLESQQFRQQDDSEFKLKMARKIVAGKILNSRHLLLRLNRKRSLLEVDRAINSIGQAEEIHQQLAAMTTLEQIRGCEGAAAASYFGALGQLISNNGFSFTTRNRRPPKDPVNALLSFGYTLLFNNVLSLMLAEGLNPYLGNLHSSDRTSAFLAFDLMEEFRWRSLSFGESPIVDTLVMRLINQKILRPTDFTFPDLDGGIYLEATPRRLFLKHFENRISTPIKYLDLAEPISYRRVIELQIRQYTQVLLAGVDYVPFRRVD